jgi:hypothetical protein
MQQKPATCIRNNKIQATFTTGIPEFHTVFITMAIKIQYGEHKLNCSTFRTLITSAFLFLKSVNQQGRNVSAHLYWRQIVRKDPVHAWCLPRVAKYLLALFSDLLQTTHELKDRLSTNLSF